MAHCLIYFSDAGILKKLKLPAAGYRRLRAARYALAIRDQAVLRRGCCNETEYVKKSTTFCDSEHQTVAGLNYIIFKVIP